MVKAGKFSGGNVVERALRRDASESGDRCGDGWPQAGKRPLLAKGRLIAMAANRAERDMVRVFPTVRTLDRTVGHRYDRPSAYGCRPADGNLGNFENKSGCFAMNIFPLLKSLNQGWIFRQMRHYPELDLRIISIQNDMIVILGNESLSNFPADFCPDRYILQIRIA